MAEAAKLPAMTRPLLLDTEGGGKMAAAAAAEGEASSFGGKTIGYWSSCCLNLNNVRPSPGPRQAASAAVMPLMNMMLLSGCARARHCLG